jgi:hypothetical protein
MRDGRGDLAGALDQYRAALAADGESQTAALALSEALHRSGRHRQAAEVLAAALQPSRKAAISPWHAYHLGPDRRNPVFSPSPAAVPVATGTEP